MSTDLLLTFINKHMIYDWFEYVIKQKRRNLNPAAGSPPLSLLKTTTAGTGRNRRPAGGSVGNNYSAATKVIWQID